MNTVLYKIAQKIDLIRNTLSKEPTSIVMNEADIIFVFNDINPKWVNLKSGNCKPWHDGERFTLWDIPVFSNQSVTEGDCWVSI